MEQMHLFIGYDSTNEGQRLAFEVCRRSALRHAAAPLAVHRLAKKELEDSGAYRRQDRTGATEFTYTRFLVPYLMGYQGFAVFCDSDFLWLQDPGLLWQHVDPTKAVSCVQHDYQACPSLRKMDGVVQEYYPRKNWSSLMVFNCGHPSVRKLTPESVEHESPAWLHRMQWCHDSEIGALPLEFNYLVGYYDDRVRPVAYHFTDGGPWYHDTRDVAHGEEWTAYLTADERRRLELELSLPPKQA